MDNKSNILISDLSQLISCSFTNKNNGVRDDLMTTLKSIDSTVAKQYSIQLLPIFRAVEYELLVEGGDTQQQIAYKMGRSVAHVNQILALNKANHRRINDILTRKISYIKVVKEIRGEE